MARKGYTGERRGKGREGCMRDTRVLYFHGEVSFIRLGSEGVVTSRRGHHLFLGWTSVSYSSQVVWSMYRGLVERILVSWSNNVC
jgi:hypothetical protein